MIFWGNQLHTVFIYRNLYPGNKFSNNFFLIFNIFKGYIYKCICPSYFDFYSLINGNPFILCPSVRYEGDAERLKLTFGNFNIDDDELNERNQKI